MAHGAIGFAYHTGACGSHAARLVEYAAPMCITFAVPAYGPRCRAPLPHRLAWLLRRFLGRTAEYIAALPGAVAAESRLAERPAPLRHPCALAAEPPYAEQPNGSSASLCAVATVPVWAVQPMAVVTMFSVAIV